MTENETKGSTIFNWWRTYIADRDSGRARALSARLRRADAIGILAEAEVHELARDLKIDPNYPDGLIRLVGTLSHIKSHVPETLPRRLGGREDRVMSNLRFQRLLRAQDDEVQTAFTRALKMADGKCNVSRLGTDILYWDHPERGETIRRRWAFEYFGSQDPSATTQHPSTETTS